MQNYSTATYKQTLWKESSRLPAPVAYHGTQAPLLQYTRHKNSQQE